MFRARGARVPPNLDHEQSQNTLLCSRSAFSSEKGRLYKDLEIDIRREIEENLAGVAAEQVRTVAIVLYCGGTDPDAGAELWVSDLSLRPKR